MSFGNIRISHSSTPYAILGEMFKLNYKFLHPYYCPTNHTPGGVTSATVSNGESEGNLFALLSSTALSVNWGCVIIGSITF